MVGYTYKESSHDTLLACQQTAYSPVIDKLPADLVRIEAGSHFYVTLKPYYLRSKAMI